ncbi:MAG: S41 family peptidase [Phycisphaeraceae bacterium]
MNRRFTAHLMFLAVVCGLLLALTNTWARQNSAFDQLGLLVDLRHELVDAYVEDPDQEALIRGAVRGMIEALDDPYTTYLPPEDWDQFNQQMEGSFSGIGAEVEQHQNRIRIVTPLEDSPAWKAGVMAGDVILEIEGESTLDMTLPEAVRLLTGEEGTDVTIRVRHENGEEQDITITRGVIQVQTVRGFRRDADQEYDFLLDDENGVGYIRLTQFGGRTVDELRQALEQLVHDEPTIQALILDVRFNGGGFLEGAVTVSDMFLEANRAIVSIEGRSEPKHEFESSSETLVPEVPVVVLANEASASASEIVAGALKDNDRAHVVGTRTYGKGSVQSTHELPGGRGVLKLTTAYWYTPSGRLIHRQPDAEQWGVDPSEGSYIPMSTDEMQAMLEARRRNDRLAPDNGQDDGINVTPEWIEQELKDPQLAGALRAALGKLDDGEWPAVGQSGADQIARTQQRKRLRDRREALVDQLNEIDRELAQFERDENGAEGAAEENEAEDEAEDGEDASDGEAQPEPADENAAEPEPEPATP